MFEKQSLILTFFFNRLKWERVHLVRHATYTIFKTNEIAKQIEKTWLPKKLP